MDLVDIERVEGREGKNINDTERYVWKPKTVKLTDKGLQALTEHDQNQTNRYEDMTRQELIEKSTNSKNAKTG